MQASVSDRVVKSGRQVFMPANSRLNKELPLRNVLFLCIGLGEMGEDCCCIVVMFHFEFMRSDVC
eukprot:15367200-Ditylum_brightwellii.AAC.2